MFTLNNKHKAILDLDKEKYDVNFQCDSNSKLNTVDIEYAIELNLKSTTPRVIVNGDDIYPRSNVEFTLEITSIEGEVKRITLVADIAKHYKKDKKSFILGKDSLKELNACILI